MAPTAPPPSLADLIFGRVALLNGRLTPEQLQALWRERRGSVASLSIGQLLIRRRLLSAEEFLQISRWLEEPLLRCPACGEGLVPRNLAAQSGPLACPSCGERLEPEPLVHAVPEGALVLPAPLPRSLRTLLSGRDSQVAGRTLGNYEILGVLGMGAMGVVYRARQLDLDRQVALKVLRAGEGASPEQIERFLAEARAAARLQHPGIVAIHEVGAEGGVHYFSMELVEGETLQARLARGERLRPEQAAALVRKVALAVHYAHQRGIVHRDLKPGNIILTPEGEPRITDFGLAKELGGDASLTRSGVAIGTPLYMSPEQVRGDLDAIDARSDVFSLGTILYHLLAGRLPFEGRSHVEIYNRILFEDPVPPRRLVRSLPRDLETICLKALHKRPRDRYQSAGALADDLGRWLAGEPIRARPLGPLERLLRTARRHRAALLAAGAVLCVAAVAWAVAVSVIERREAAARRQAQQRLARERAELLAAARQALAAGRTREAAERAQALLLQYPDSPEAEAARLVQGRAELVRGRLPAAERAFAEALLEARAPATEIEALLGLAEASERVLALERAQRALERALARMEEAGSPPQVLSPVELRLARVLAARGQTPAARPLLQAALAAGALGEPERRAALALQHWLEHLGAPALLAGAEAGAVGDLDGDGRAELALVHGDRVAIYRAEGTRLGLVGEARLPELVGRAEAAVAARLAGQGREQLAIVAGDRCFGRALSVLEVEAGGGSGTRASEHELVVRVGARAHVAGMAAPPAVAVLEGTAAPGGGRGESGGSAEGGAAAARAELVLARAGGAWGGEPRAFALAAGGELVSAPVAADLPRAAAPLAVAAADLDGDGVPELLFATAGPGGAEVRVVRRAGAGGSSGPLARWRAGPAGALAAADLERDGRLQVVAAVGQGRGAVASAAGASPATAGLAPPGLHVLEFRGGPGACELVPRAFAPLTPLWPEGEQHGQGEAPEHGWEVRPLALACADLTAAGAPAVALLALVAPPPGLETAPARAVLVLLDGFGFLVGPRRFDRVFEGPLPEWLATGDLDADGDADLVLGGPSFVHVYGLREAQR
ncbi:MAG: hypothetical protein KatS3mg102_1961 [Planctomycetota bacterium]|nr:MAG: hypothetical protein KatS3mg102_1961 [Planctomycetota bacterium]